MHMRWLQSNISSKTITMDSPFQTVAPPSLLTRALPQELPASGRSFHTHSGGASLCGACPPTFSTHPITGIQYGWTWHPELWHPRYLCSQHPHTSYLVRPPGPLEFSSEFFVFVRYHGLHSIAQMSGIQDT